MNLFKRFIYYFIGLSLGSIVVYFIWTGKDVSFDYGMDARTTDASAVFMKELKIDSLAIRYILTKGDVNFSKSNQHKKPCPEYAVYGDYQGRTIDLWITRCETLATVETIEIRD